MKAPLSWLSACVFLIFINANPLAGQETVLDQHKSNCAELAEYGFLKLNHVVFDRDRLKNAFKSFGNLPSVQDIVASLGEFGVDAKPIKTSSAELRVLPVPMIVHLEFAGDQTKQGHFTLVVASSDKGVTCIDPLFDANKAVVMPWPTFDAVFTGHLIISSKALLEYDKKYRK